MPTTNMQTTTTTSETSSAITGRTYTAPGAGRRRPRRGALADAGKEVTRHVVSCDVVGAREAAARTGAEAGELMTRLSKRSKVTLVEGYGSWLVDLRTLAGDSGQNVTPSGIVILERGESL